jgi:hypothetical protein
LLFELFPVFDGEEHARDGAFGVGEILDVHAEGK